MTTEQAKASDPRPRGRPRLDIDDNDVADAVAELIAERGVEGLTFNDAAEKLSVSRATLYRTIPTKEHLLAVLLVRSMNEMNELVADALKRIDDPAEQLLALVELQIDAAIRMRQYMPLFFGQGDMPAETYTRWQGWARDFEQAWVEVVRRNMQAGTLADGDPVITARLLLGACLWVSRWYRPTDRFTAEQIRQSALDLVNSMVPPRAAGEA
ncbi:TetR/AcrR family transcriptional regulator [Aeromicrobium fastidiosum]|uniref:TetR/AcrR family transcriptional regulator n=1 Tax=Aeromicrobium fastidiosum TaxID=52699 RepID=A0A641AP70_9ACTN|nr:TetR/AcrR family transcriptional regulator [Aeromicrobium fastidiosum]KAA1379886.1 TetR/AcrR family transcriptional regulator [Aeromicrobium fastidiosum]MBP2389390.1 AcrR family transcriptional regulator [Aeromicrobium fastidiosum]